MSKDGTGLSRAMWRGMWARCTNPRNDGWLWYGARGIDVCEGWSSFAAFVADIGPRPSSAHSLDRIDNDGGYWCGRCRECVAHGRPFNVRWATSSEQRRNQRPRTVKAKRPVPDVRPEEAGRILGRLGGRRARWDGRLFAK